MDEDDEELTHYGQSLADIGNFDDAGLKLTDDEDEGLLHLLNWINFFLTG